MSDTTRHPVRRGATLHDVAGLVGVSARTVSRVVNDQGGFSDATRTRVMDAVAELNYRPNVHARRLISGRTGVIGFLAPVLSDPFFPECMEGVEHAARDAGLTVLLATSSHDAGREADVLASLEGHRLDGLVVFPIGDTARLVPFLDRGMCMVAIDTPLEHRHGCSVLSDLEAGTRAAVERFVSGGRRRLAMIDNIDEPVHRRRRRAAFVSAVPDDVESVIVDVDWTMDGGRDAARILVRDHPDVDGVFAYNDVMALGAMQVLQEAGRRVPDDIAIIGCDDIQFASSARPALTTVAIDRARLGSEAVRLLMELAGGATDLEPVTVATSLVVRDSG